MKLWLASTLIWGTCWEARGLETWQEEKTKCPESGNPLSPGQPLLWRYALPWWTNYARGKHLPDKIYFMIFHSRGNNTKPLGEELVRKGKLGTMEIEPQIDSQPLVARGVSSSTEWQWGKNKRYEQSSDMTRTLQLTFTSHCYTATQLLVWRKITLSKAKLLN